MVTESPIVRSLSEVDMDAVKDSIVPFLYYFNIRECKKQMM